MIYLFRLVQSFILIVVAAALIRFQPPAMFGSIWASFAMSALLYTGLSVILGNIVVLVVGATASISLGLMTGGDAQAVGAGAVLGVAFGFILSVLINIAIIYTYGTSLNFFPPVPLWGAATMSLLDAIIGYIVVSEWR